MKTGFIGCLLLLTCMGLYSAAAQSKSADKARLISLAKTTEQEEPLNVKSMDAQVGKAYQLYQNAIASLETKPKHKLFIVHATTGTLSLDSQYVVMNTSIILSPRTPKGEKIDFREFPISNELSLQNAAGNVLWTKTYEWAGTKDGGLGIGKVSRGAKSILAFMSDTSANAPESEFSDIIVVFNKTGKEVYRVMLSGQEPINPELTKNGRYFYMGESKPWPSKEEVWTIVDLDKEIKKEIVCIVGEDGTPQIYEDGKIIVLSVGYVRKVFTFDSLALPQKDQEHEK